MTHPTPDHSRAELIADLRTFAGFLEGTPELPVPRHLDITIYPLSDSDEAMRAEIDRISAVLGTTPVLDSGHYRTAKAIGRVTYRAVAITRHARQQWQALMSYDGAITPDRSATSTDGR